MKGMWFLTQNLRQELVWVKLEYVHIQYFDEERFTLMHTYVLDSAARGRQIIDYVCVAYPLLSSRLRAFAPSARAHRRGKHGLLLYSFPSDIPNWVFIHFIRFSHIITLSHFIIIIILNQSSIRAIRETQSVDSFRICIWSDLDIALNWVY